MLARRRPLTFQTLEARQTFAADLALQIANGDITLTGDGDAEAITIEEVTVSALLQREFITITGRNGTTINGQNAVSFNSSLIRNVNIQLNGGADQITIDGLDSDIAGGSLTLKTGGGSDQLFLENMRFDGNITIETEGQDDLGFLGNIVAGQTLTVNTGNDDDELTLADASARNIHLTAGFGDDGFAVVNTTATDQLFASMDDGDDVLVLSNARAFDFVLDGGDNDDDQLFLVLSPTAPVGNRFGLKALSLATNFETVTVVQ